MRAESPKDSDRPLPPARPAGEPPPVVYFDGVCGLCNRFVDFLLRVDSQAILRFAPLQGETARRLLPPSLADELDTMAFADRHGHALRSEAVLRILARLGGIWRLAGMLRIVPRPLRDWVYDAVARRRYRLFGRLPACRLPTPEERARFLP